MAIDLTTLTTSFAVACVPLVAVLFTRRASLRQMDTNSDATVSGTYKELVNTLQAEAIRHTAQVKDLTDRVAQLESRADQAQRAFTQQLSDAHAENSRLSTRVAQLQTDLDIATRQVAELRSRMKGM